MTTWLDDSSAINHYYDGDFPGMEYCRYPENFDPITEHQGLRHDVPRYLELARRQGGPVLEPCCGTGRVTLPIAAAGLDVVGVDYSRELLRQLEAKLAAHGAGWRERVRIERQDVTELALGRRDFALAILAFNSLLCIPDFAAQSRALAAIAAHLRPGGLLLLDVVNPLLLPLQGDAVPKPFFTRRNPHSGRRYTRFAMLSPLDAEQRQDLHGWYDEIDEHGAVHRRAYRVTWRPVFRYEIELMLRGAGFALERIEGGHRAEPYTAQSAHLLLHARRAGS